MTAPTISAPLKNQKRISANIRAELNSVNEEYSSMSAHRNRVDVKDHAEFVARHKSLFFRSLELQADLKRSEALERAIERRESLTASANAA